ncbi:MAG: FliM/FliN family flagellar motor switch protein [Vicinamibacterales bacterium]
MSSSPNSSSSSDASALASLHDVTCGVDIVLGSSAFSVRDCLSLKPNTLIRLHEFAGADMQVVINGVPVAMGEVVIIDDSTAIRVTDILPPPSSEAGE